MPTATLTTETTTPAKKTSVLPLKASPAITPEPETQAPSATSAVASTSTSTSIAATLRSLYSRAARAFLHRDVSLTYSLLGSAFALIPPPARGSDDGFADHRRKWDILRITLEVTVYTAPLEDASSLPPALRSNATLSSASLVTGMYTRSVQFFQPNSTSSYQRVWVPWQVIVTLVLASVKTGCPDIGKGMVEEWLSRRGSDTSEGSGQADDAEGYEKILETYCLNVLPALEEWDYASDFLEYENELDIQTKERLTSTLSIFRTQNQLAALPSLQPRSSPSIESVPSSSQTTPRPSRSPSPTPSSHSSTSTHTVVPNTPKARPNGTAVGTITPLSPSPRHAGKRTPASSAATSRTVTPPPGAQRPVPKFRETTRSTSTPAANGHATPNGHTSALVSALGENGRTSSSSSSTTRAPSALAVVRAFIQPYLSASLPTHKLVLALGICLLELLHEGAAHRLQARGLEDRAGGFLRAARGLGQGLYSALEFVGPDGVQLARADVHGNAAGVDEEVELEVAECGAPSRPLDVDSTERGVDGAGWKCGGEGEAVTPELRRGSFGTQLATYRCTQVGTMSGVPQARVPARAP
ncbi:hypothetical protein EWM64_g9739 [Hericium alpestre]|uniref:Uncharacterized protein n=1 Tax=Hericium alpestre TaxID=135208 RepID=A0A4Y9ZK51_9AGAM|nr:hypothetical protein EWM64_g9739 [Hericium alpestre]